MHLVCNCCSNGNPSPAQTFSSLFTFNYAEGANPNGALVQATDGNLYGTTWAGGHGYGVVFVIDSGTVTPLHSFESSDGAFPNAAWCRLPTETFMEQLTVEGPRQGTVFEITSTGAITTLYSFSSSTGLPVGRAGAGMDGNFYGQLTKAGQ